MTALVGDAEAANIAANISTVLDSVVENADGSTVTMTFGGEAVPPAVHLYRRDLGNLVCAHGARRSLLEAVRRLPIAVSHTVEATTCPDCIEWIHA